MKGKGKHHPTQASTSSSTAEKECPLQFPIVQSVDHVIECPVYTSAVQRSEIDGLSYEDLEEGLQSDLETLLAAVAKRMRLLENEIQTLNSWQDSKSVLVKKGGKSPAALAGSKRGKGGASSDDRPVKKMREGGGKGVGRPPKHPKIISSKPSDTIALAGSDAISPPQVELPQPAVVPHPKFKNDLPNKFWALVEPYCSDITNDDLKVLEDMIKQHEEDSELCKVPPLGTHYSVTWAEEDVEDEQSEGSKLSDKKRPTDTSKFFKKPENGAREDSSTLGPLTQRLVSALIEENIMTPVDDASMEDVTGIDPSEFNASMSPRSLARQLNIGNTLSLERRLKRELEEQGILDCEERNDEHPDDEVLMEMRRKIQELKMISAHNLKITSRLLEMGRAELARQQVRKRLAAADAEVMDAYRKIQSAKQKKRTPTKKEREVGLRALRERAALAGELEKLYEQEDNACG